MSQRHEVDQRDEIALIRRDPRRPEEPAVRNYDLNAAGSVLSWDEATYMPKWCGGAGSAVAVLRRLAHERFVDPTLGRLMEQLEPRVDKLSADDASLLRVVRRDYEKAIKIPAEYVARANAHSSRSYNAWTKARPANDFAAMIPFFEKTLDLSREYARSPRPTTT